jgi:hypothetical protein
MRRTDPMTAPQAHPPDGHDLIRVHGAREHDLIRVHVDSPSDG